MSKNAKYTPEMLLAMRNATSHDRINAMTIELIFSTVIVWLKILSRQQWQFKRDAPRVRSAFEKLAAESDEWPNPADFTRALLSEPLRLEPRLEDKHTATEYDHRMAQEIIGRLKDAPLFQTEWIHGTRSRSVDECKKIYAARQK